MNDIFLTADTHFQHANIIIYSNRPFIHKGDTIIIDDKKKWVSNEIAAKRCEEMNESLIANWNSKVKKDSIIYHLGDICFGDYRNILRRLNGKIFLILGSHDGNAFDYQEYFLDIKRLHEFKQGDYDITLCHYAMRVWPRSHFNSWHLYGHSHSHLESFGKSFDVGVDANNFFPLSLEEVKERMNKLPNNFNLVKKD